jgi:hypothetical protein
MQKASSSFSNHQVVKTIFFEDVWAFGGLSALSVGHRMAGKLDDTHNATSAIPQIRPVAK